MVHMPPRRTSLQVDVSRDLYIVCAFMYQGMPHQQAQAFTVAHNPLKALADSGAAFHCSHGRLLSALSLPRRKDFWRLHFELGKVRKRKIKQRKIARGIFRSLAPLLGTAGSLSDCGIKPTIAELNFSRR